MPMGDLQRTGGTPRRRGAVRFRVSRRPAQTADGPPLQAAEGRKKRKRMAVARLGGARRSIFGAVRRLQVRWLAYRRALRLLRLLRAFCARAFKDLLDGAAAASTVHAQAGANCSYGFPAVVTVGGRY